MSILRDCFCCSWVHGGIVWRGAICAGDVDGARRATRQSAWSADAGNWGVRPQAIFQLLAMSCIGHFLTGGSCIQGAVRLRDPGGARGTFRSECRAGWLLAVRVCGAGVVAEPVRAATGALHQAPRLMDRLSLTETLTN